MARRKVPYLAGEAYRNRCRLWEDTRGRYILEWRAAGMKKRLFLEKTIDWKSAKQEADDKAAQLGRQEAERRSPITMDRLLDLYLKEATPRKKSRSKQEHDARAVKVWKKFFEERRDPDRRGNRHPSSLDRTDWDDFISDRRAGNIDWRGKNKKGRKRKVMPVKDRQVRYDLQFLLAVLNWSMGRRIEGVFVLEMNPWNRDIRRAQKWKMPKEKNPFRPTMTPEIREGLIRHPPSWELELALRLGFSQCRRNSSVRQLIWSDIDQHDWEILWREETDKVGREGKTPIMDEEVIELLKRAYAVELLQLPPDEAFNPEKPVFPSAVDSDRPMSRHEMQTQLKLAKRAWIKSTPLEDRSDLQERLRGMGFHSEKRARVQDPEFRAMAPKAQEAWSGTKWSTLRDRYDHMGVNDIRAEARAAKKRVMASR